MEIDKKYFTCSELSKVFKITYQAMYIRAKFFDIGRRKGYTRYTINELEQLIRIDYFKRIGIVSFKDIKIQMIRHHWI